MPTRFLFAGCLALLPHVAAADEPLASWRDQAAKQSIVGFVERVTNEASADYVLPADRVAVFDNDGTLWAEQPAYFQLLFAADRVAELAPEHPAWRQKEPFASVLKGDLKAALSGGAPAVAKLIGATHAGMTAAEFDGTVRRWITSARHPTTRRSYPDMTYAPMKELLAYLRANGFKTFIVSGGGIDFLRVWSQQVYGVPPEQVVGSSLAATYEVRDDGPVIVRGAEIDFINDKAGKPVGIYRRIGRRPTIAVGNSDGDFAMLEWTTAGAGPRLGVLIHHTDADREWAYDRDSHIGRLERGLDEAPSRDWVIVDMKADWTKVFSASGTPRP